MAKGFHHQLFKIVHLTLLVGLLVAPLFSLSSQSNIQTEKSPSEKIMEFADLAGKAKYNNTIKAISYCDSAMLLLREFPDPIQEGEIWEAYGSTYYIKGEFDKAFENFINAKNIYDALGLEEKIAQSYNQLGLIYISQDDLVKAIKILNQAVEINLRYEKYDELSKNHTNLGIAKVTQSEYKNAVDFFQKSIFFAEKVENNKLIARNYTFLGECMLELNALDSSEYHYKKALQMTDPNNEWDICFVKAGYAKLLLKKGEYNQAMVQGMESLTLAKNLDAQWEMERIYKILADVQEARGKHAEALQLYKQYKQVSDSLMTVEKNKEILQLEISNKELENDRLKINNQLQQSEIQVKNIWLGVGLGIMVIFILGIFVLYLNYQKKIEHSKVLEAINNTIEEKNVELEKANKTKSRMFSIISHDLVNPLSSIQGILEFVKNETITKEEFYDILDKLIQHLSIVNLTINNLLHWSRNEIHGKANTEEKVNIKQLIEEAVNLMAPTAERFKIDMKVVLCPEEVFMKANENEISLMIRNLVSNAIKFTPKQGKILVKCETLKSDQFILSVEDTGVGLSENQIKNILNFQSRNYTKGLHGESGTGLGLLFCMQTIEMHGGKLDIQSEIGEGSKFSVIINRVT